jgi:cyclopropane-fatty-acyl-phospholipid synthase
MPQQTRSRPLTAPASPDARAAEGAPIRALDRLLRWVGDPPVRLRLWDGTEVGTADPAAPTLVVHNRRALYRLLLHPELYFGEAYTERALEVEGDLVGFLEIAYRAIERAPAPGPLRRAVMHWLARPRRNTLAGSRRNIHRHYDIGNDFYRQWLDREMVYTCAYFPEPTIDLEAAQIAKMDHVCRKLGLRPGEEVVEAGCGWGSLALHMARHYGVRVRAYNISQAQIAYARERARAEGLSDRVSFIEDDYRNVANECDAFVSVGMLEHVGRDHYHALGAVIERCLRPHGRALLHSIGRNRPRPMNAWIERHIFPGAYPPTLREMLEILEPWQFSVLDVENLRLHYALTLRHWLERYEQASEAVHAAFDESFVRAWRLYLAGSVAAFTTGALQLFQVLFVRPENNALPWNRAHLYDDVVRRYDDVGQRA